MLITERKVLEKDIATSIIISTELMRKCEELKMLTTNRENEYYHIKQTNLAIAHIEKDFCCLTDYMVTTVSNPEELQSLPHMLSAVHFAVYQRRTKYWTSRDWIENSANNMKIGYIIKYLIHGQGCKLTGQSLDHLSETWNELDVNNEFTYNNPNDGSHRKPIFINTIDQLLAFIEVLRAYEKNGAAGYVFKDI